MVGAASDEDDEDIAMNAEGNRRPAGRQDGANLEGELRHRPRRASMQRQRRDVGQTQRRGIDGSSTTMGMYILVLYIVS